MHQQIYVPHKLAVILVNAIWYITESEMMCLDICDCHVVAAEVKQAITWANVDPDICHHIASPVS